MTSAHRHTVPFLRIRRCSAPDESTLTFASLSENTFGPGPTARSSPGVLTSQSYDEKRTILGPAVPDGPAGLLVHPCRASDTPTVTRQRRAAGQAKGPIIDHYGTYLTSRTRTVLAVEPEKT